MNPADSLKVRRPDVIGLRFRRFRGPEDYPMMHAVTTACKNAAGIEYANSLADIARYYAHLVNCDPAQDMIFAEVEGQVVGYGRVWWEREGEGRYLYQQFVHILPAWQGQGIRRAMLRHNERRIAEIAAGHEAAIPKFIQVWVEQGDTDWQQLVEEEGYTPERYFFEMVRPHLDAIPDLPLPAGLEVRRVPPECYYRVWKTAEEAFQDHWGATDWHDTWFEGWQKEPTFQPHLWQVAWDGDEIAGMVLNFIDEAQNEKYARQRGYTETICVRRPWRRRGLARALIARSLRVLKEAGMTEAALGVDADNQSRALRLYEEMGFRTIRQNTVYYKPLPHEAQ